MLTFPEIIKQTAKRNQISIQWSRSTFFVHSVHLHERSKHYIQKLCTCNTGK